MRKLRLLVVTAVAVFGLCAVAFAQTANDITFTAVAGSGGTKAKPKAGSLVFKYSNQDPAGNQLAPVKTFQLFVGNGVINPTILPSCTAAKMQAAAQTGVVGDSVCPAASKIGTGSIQSVGGAVGAPVSSGAACTGSLNVYNAGVGHAALWITLAPPACPLTQAEAIPVSLIKKSGGVQMTFSVPDDLLNITGLDVSVLKFSTTIRKIVKKGKPYVGATCGKAKTRKYSIKVTDTKGGTQSSSGSSKC